jgi:hypothetical protein
MAAYQAMAAASAAKSVKSVMKANGSVSEKHANSSMATIM